MDGTRFDALTRLMGVGAPRRRVLKGLLGLAVGAGAAVSIRPSAQAGNVCTIVDPTCPSGQVCCLVEGTGICTIGECCGATDLGSCGPGESCDPETLTCVTNCVVDGEVCELSLDCCDPRAVCENSVCVVNCLPPGDACTSDVECCNGLCCDGLCEDAVCCTDADCGTSEVCSAGNCVCSITADGETCDADADCCSNVCCGGTCQFVQCCMEDEDPNARCPEGSTCFEGICDAGEETGGDIPVLEPGTDGSDNITTLPNTGIGNGSETGNGVIGLGVAAGAAALLASRKLRQSGEPSAE